MFVFVALGIQHAMYMHRVVICGLSGSTMFFHIIHGTIFGGGEREREVTEHNMCVLISSETFLILRRNELDVIKTYIGLRVKCHYSCSILKKLEFFRQIFEQSSNIMFHENPFSGNRVVPC